MNSNINTDTNTTDSVNHDIISALTSVSSRLSAIEQHIQKTEEQLQQGAASQLDGVNSPTSLSSHRPSLADSDVDEEVVTPTPAFLKSSRGIQDAVDRRLQELASLNERGMFKSQCGGNEQVTVKNKIPWPQNHILAGTSKSRVTYDSLSTFQWVSGFCAIIKDEKNVNTKNQMLDYMSELMDDAQDFGWPSAKGAHAVLLCRMEEGKVNWSMTEKIDRIRRAHAQKVINVAPKRSILNPRVYLVNFFSHRNVPIRLTTTLGDNFTGIYVVFAIHWENAFPTLSKSVEIQNVSILIQKTNQALHNCSAKIQSFESTEYHHC